MILGINLHLEMTTQTAVSIFDRNLYFTVHRLCKFAWQDIAFSGICVFSNDCQWSNIPLQITEIHLGIILIMSLLTSVQIINSENCASFNFLHL